MVRSLKEKICITCGTSRTDPKAWYGLRCRPCYRKTPKAKQIDHNNYAKKKYSLKERYRKAKNRYKDWDISFDDFSSIVINPCTYCEKELTLETGICLDRIDNNKGHTKENCMACCGDCNVIKNTKLTVEEMKVAMSAVLKLRRKNV